MTIDPRADLTEDAPLWNVLLPLARDYDADDSDGAFAALLAARCLGVTLSVGRSTLALAAKPPCPFVEWVDVRAAHFVPNAKAITDLLRLAYSAGGFSG